MPDAFLVSKGFIDEAHERVRTTRPDYPGHGTGLFFVGVEQDGVIYAYALNQTDERVHAGGDDRQRLPRCDGARVRAGDQPPVGGLRRHVQGRSATLDIAQCRASAVIWLCAVEADGRTRTGDPFWP